MNYKYTRKILVKNPFFHTIRFRGVEQVANTFKQKLAYKKHLAVRNFFFFFIHIDSPWTIRYTSFPDYVCSGTDVPLKMGWFDKSSCSGRCDRYYYGCIRVLFILYDFDVRNTIRSLKTHARPIILSTYTRGTLLTEYVKS